MEILTFFSIIFIGSILITITLFSIIIGFGVKSLNIRDPFEEHED